MERTTKLNEEFGLYLEKSRPQMVDNIKKLLTYENVKFINNKTKADMVAFCFEYEYDYFDIIFYGIDKEWNAVTETVTLPSPKNNKATEDSNWKAFMSEEIWREFIDFEDNYEGDDLEDIISEYEEVKYKLFEEWFCSCWKEAEKQHPISIDAYFSIHDTIFKTDLKSMKEVKEKDILMKYKEEK
ncbi:MAG: hypothetical protein E6772_06190 [Dysgonomonas sp.]|nr:hypothetical protein [Dysgonomonas sp.]